MEKKQLKLFTMDVKEYQEIIKKTAVFPKEIGLTYCTMGLCGEAGEVANKVKKRTSFTLLKNKRFIF